MPTYIPPIDDIRFVLTRLIGLERLSALPGYDSVSDDLAETILTEAGKIAAEQFAPLNQSGDKAGAVFLSGGVQMPAGFKEAYQAFVDGGWNSLPTNAEIGGQGLPWSFSMPMQEMLQAANLSLALCTLLNQGAIELFEAHGSEALKKKFMPKMVSGEWAGTMNLTEPQAGSDVAAIKCKAVKDGDAYRITGQKIFISYGDHDLSENIIHFVLARLPDAPEGTKGLSLFLVPKILVNDNGTSGAANDVRAVSIEHKLGQHASPTCIMSYGDKDGAIGYLIGEENGGIAAMFTMMNNARIGVGIQALGLMDRAYQAARDYAKTRVQSRDIAKPKQPPVTIINHPDVRRMLMVMKSYTEAARALAYSCAYAVDVSRRSTDTAQKAWATARVDLLTPIVKSWLTDLSNELSSLGVQIWGGMGFVEESGVAQYMRDARVLAIYEGTNGIQANDLVFRKVSRDKGAALHELFQEIDLFLPKLAAAKGDDLSTIHKHLDQAIDVAKKSTQWVLDTAPKDPALAAASASNFLRLISTMLGGYYLAQSAVIAQTDLPQRLGNPKFLSDKIITARFYAEHALPLCQALAKTVSEGANVILATTEEYF
jgi:alkylation response protein AidB-like acyl-CoA dehydrogenase